MAIVNFSIDTNTRQAALTVDGQIISAIACHFSKGIDFDGESFLRFSYIVEIKNDNGLIERREFFLPDSDDNTVIASIKDGLASKVLGDDEIIPGDRATSDIIKFMQSRKTKK